MAPPPGRRADGIRGGQVTAGRQASGDRSIVVGRDVIRSVLITGDQNQVFVGDYEQLQDAYIEPWSVFQRADIANFVGREWLTAEIDAFIATEDRGYFVLEASAGVGKTAFLAHLVQERGYIHHFVELARGPEGVAPALKSLAAQVVRAGELLPYSTEEVLPPTAGSRPDFFAHLLKRFSERRASSREKLVIVVDALDEAGAPVGHNVLGLPEVLPRGVYLVVSQRPVPVTLNTDAPLQVLSMDASHERNLEDMRRFLDRAVGLTPLRAVVDRSDRTAAEVVDALLQRSAGVWIYLHYVLTDLSRDHAVLVIDALPDGVWAYYARFWRRWRDSRPDEWHSVYLPLLATLAVVQEDAPAELLAVLAGVPSGSVLASLLDEHWLPFLAVSEGSGERRYRPYHASVREFLEGQLDRPGRRAMDAALARELERAVRDAHSRIAVRYLDLWGGLEAGLPGLSVGSALLVDGGYGFRHLVAHLAKSGQGEQVDRLLALHSRGCSGLSNTWFAAHDLSGDLSGYQADVVRGWRLAEARSEQELRLGPAPSIATEARYALHVASVNALASSVPPSILAGLARVHIWPPAKALAYARQITDQHDRAQALGALAAVTPPELQPELLATVEALGDGPYTSYRSVALAELADHLPDPLVRRAARALKGKRSYANNRAAACLAVRLGRAGQWDEALRLLGSYPEAQADAFAAVVTDILPDQLDGALSLAAADRSPVQRAKTLAALLPRLKAGGPRPRNVTC